MRKGYIAPCSINCPGPFCSWPSAFFNKTSSYNDISFVIPQLFYEERCLRTRKNISHGNQHSCPARKSQHKTQERTHDASSKIVIKNRTSGFNQALILRLPWVSYQQRSNFLQFWLFSVQVSGPIIFDRDHWFLRRWSCSESLNISGAKHIF